MVTLRAYGGGLLFADHREGILPSLLGLHGWGRSRNDLGRLLAATGHESVAPDLPGFGASPPPPNAWGASDYATAVAEQVANRSDQPSYVVIGHSFGGRVGLCMAANYPSLVSGLVLMGVPILRMSPTRRSPLRYRIIRAAARARLVSTNRLESARHRFGSEDYRSVDGVMRDVLVRVVNEDYRIHLERIRCPVAFVWGAEDRVVPFSVATNAAECIDSVVAIEVVEGVGHDVHLEAQSRVEKAISTIVTALT